MEILLRASGLTKRYGSVVVLDGVSFDLPRGSATLVTGRSGSGKSTLFKLLAGLDTPTSGGVEIEGVPIAQLGEKELAQIRLRRIGLVFQSFNLLPDLTAAENVRLPLDLADVPRLQAEERVAELLRIVGVEHRARARPNVLSGGEQQRVAVARALANEPSLILADEPTGNLDRRNADNVFRLLRDINVSLGTTLVIITHDALAENWFSRKIRLEDGRSLPEPSGTTEDEAPTPQP